MRTKKPSAFVASFIDVSQYHRNFTNQHKDLVNDVVSTVLFLNIKNQNTATKHTNCVGTFDLCNTDSLKVIASAGVNVDMTSYPISSNT